MNLVEMERKEVQRREEELRQRKHLLEEKKRKHAKIENDIIEQVYLLILSIYWHLEILKTLIHCNNEFKRLYNILIAEANFD